MFTASQAEALLKLAGLAELEPLVRAVAGCGFDPAIYLADNSGLTESGYDAGSAAFHFLAYGYGEDRNLICGPLPEGLSAFRQVSIPNRAYAAGLFRTLFFGQLRDPKTADRVWHVIDAGLIECLRAMGGLPYVIFGDSHTNHYLRKASVGERWLAPLPVVCHGASAIALGNPNSRLGYGERILDWARMAAGSGTFNAPIFLKFGGLDAEFRWMWRRLQNGVRQFSLAEYDEFARFSAAGYGAFLDRLSEILGNRVLRVCSVFPSALADAYWAEIFIEAYRATPEEDRDLAARLRDFEIPRFATRTQLRALYNYYLRSMCRQKGLVFVDDFAPFVGRDGSTDPRCYLRHGGRDNHLDRREIDAEMAGIVEHFVSVEAN